MKDSADTQTAICIAGAHRSGTSMVTRLLHACGLYLGPRNELMPAQPDNPDGFWEHLGFVAVNDELLNALGGAWDLPPKSDETFSGDQLDPLRLKARLLIEGFDSSTVWGWKDPRNSLTLPFWQDLLPGMKTLIVLRNPLEVAFSMKERNGTSYSFGLRLWEIYNRRVIEAANKQERLVTHYDLFFQDPESELRRIAHFSGLPDAAVEKAAMLVKKRRRHTHFTVEHLIDARVAPEVIELYRALVAEVSQGVRSKPGKIESQKSDDVDLLPGAVSRLNAFIPERIAQVEHLYQELLAQTETRHRNETEKLKTQVEQIKAQVEQINDLLLEKNVSLAKSEAHADELKKRLIQQLKATKKLSQLLDDTNKAAEHLRSSGRWQIANPMAALKAKLSPNNARRLLGYGHLEKIISIYKEWRKNHPEIRVTEDEIHALASGTVGRRKRSLAPPEPPEPTRPIQFPMHERVDVSIIIPVFNQFRFTQACLASIQEYYGPHPLEVIVVDDCSTDATAEAIPRTPGVVYLRNETNKGFIASCNRGAQKARGKYLVFLNNDTLVTEGWLSALTETFDEEPQAGVVGSKLIYPDGLLQEAGGIIWQDASGWNYGKSDDPAKPEFNYLREADYCSAASLMIPKSLFDSVGGFDSIYAPAYYEDADLAFKVRKTGYRVLYQPLSEVIHYEGATGGTDLSTGTKKHQAINRSTFAETWAAELMAKPVTGDLTFLQQPRRGKKNILVIDHHLPMFDKDAGSVRMFHVLNILRQSGHRVTFVPDNLANIAPYGQELQKRGIEIIYHPYFKKVRDFLRSRGTQFDAVVLSRCDFARKHIADARLYAPQSRIIFDTVDLHFLRTDREAQLTNNSETREKARQHEEMEYDLIDQADETWVVSGVEQKLLREAKPGKSIEIVPTIVDVPGSKTPFALRRDWLFIGGFQHRPNIDAVLFFVKDVYPLVSQHLRDTKFYIIGDKPPPEVAALANERIVVAGLQRDVRQFFDSVKLSVAPLRFGAGVKGKINQSMAFGVPVVATSLAIEGMELQDREDILVADDPKKFAEALVELYESDALWNRLSENGIRKTQALYSTDAARKKLEFLFSEDHLTSLREAASIPEGETAAVADVHLET